MLKIAVSSPRARAAEYAVPRFSPAAVISALFAILLGAYHAPALAVTSSQFAVSERAVVYLHANRTVAAPGDTVSVALQQELNGAWHTYWVNPGDSGFETTMDWTTPEGVLMGPIEWPAPHRIRAGPLVNYGFKTEAILISTFQVPQDWPVGAPLPLSVDAEWLICDDICVPESQRYELSIPVGDVPVVDAAAAEIIARGRSSQPVPVTVDARYRVEGNVAVLQIAASDLVGPGVENVYFFPENWRMATPSAPQSVVAHRGGVEIRLALADQSLDGDVPGVLRAVDRGSEETAGETAGGAGDIALSFTASPGALDLGPVVGSVAGAGPAGPDGSGRGLSAGASGNLPIDLGLGLGTSLVAAAALAFLGGVILNIMPCVFPVLALKAMSVARASNEHRGADAAAFRAERRWDALAYSGGVMVSFLGFAAILIGLKAAGASVGWGFQLQQPVVVAALAYVLVLVGLNLSGVFEVSFAAAGVGDSWTRREGPTGSFFTGVLAALVASPCTAPFMGAALGYALTQDAVTTVAVFAALGLGFAAPLALLSASPTAARWTPKPGPWMARFRAALAFPMYLSAAWLFWVLGNQSGVDALFAALVGAVLLALAAWSLGAGYPTSVTGRRVAGGVAALSILGAVWALGPTLNPSARQGGSDARAASTGPVAAEPGRESALPYDPARLAALRAEGAAVFVNATADWCISCKVNERMVLNRETFRERLASQNVSYMVADWTVRDPEVTALLREFGRVGVPLYVVYPPGGGAPEILPQILTEAAVFDALTPR